MKYFVYKRYGNNNLYWNYDSATWVSRKDASIYTEKQKESIEKSDGVSANWHEVVAEPVKYGEQPRPIPVIIGDGKTECQVDGYYWLKIGKNIKAMVIRKFKGETFVKGCEYIHIKEPAWPQ